jgi:hypothetical protein
MRTFYGLLALALCLGCQPPTVGLAPVPAPAKVEALRQSQSRVLPIPMGKVFPKVLGILMDLGYQIRCVDQGAGQINIYQSWKDDTHMAQPDMSMEATLLFEPRDADSTSVRIVASGNWSFISSGKHSSGTVTSSQPTLDSSECGRLLEILEQRLCASSTAKQ